MVLAGKAGKLGKTKAAKAQPSLSYGSGSYSMSTGPSPPAYCPCFDQTDLLVVTSNNVNPDFTNCDGDPWRLQNNGGKFFEAGTAQLGYVFCENQNFDAIITDDDYDVCRDLIINRCSQINLPN
jgi:hypothetical protein